MKLEQGKKYKHRKGFVGIFSHSDDLNYNHFFKTVENPDKWKEDELGMVDFPTWDLERNMKAVRYDIISPDGISIVYGVDYASLEPGEDAMIALDAWVKRFEAQGYYSSNSGRIDLKDLKDNCSYIEIEI